MKKKTLYSVYVGQMTGGLLSTVIEEKRVTYGNGIFWGEGEWTAIFCFDFPHYSTDILKC